MSLPTLSGVELNTVYTAHAENFIKRKVVDQFYLKTPTLHHLRSKGKTEDGGEFLICPVLEGHEPVGQAYRESETVTMAYRNPATQARYQWAFYEEPIVIFHQHEQKARGLNKKLDLVEISVRAAAKRLRRKIAQALFKAAPGTEEIQGLLQAAPTDPTASGAYGGLDGAAGAQSWWRNKVNAAVGAAATELVPAMRTLFNELSEGEEAEGKPTLIVTTQAVHEAYEALCSAKQDLRSLVTQSAAVKQMADLGFDTLSFKGTPLVWDPYCPSGNMFFLSNEACQLVELRGGAFTIFDFQWGIAQGLFGRVSAMRFEAQLGTYERRCIGRLAGITT